ncbi:MAG: prepilin peptidase [Patescibacteria group bacterium]|jgi:prepilin signal peptidase PulO-like enzyme (type II secretory pathway)
MVIEIVIGGIFGSIIASAIGCAAMRAGDGRSFFYGRSLCDGCQKILHPLALIPILSFCFQKGRARCCGVRLSRIYLLLEMVGAILGGYIGYEIWQGVSTWGVIRWILVIGFILWTIATDGHKMLVSLPVTLGFSVIMMILPFEYGTIFNRLFMAGCFVIFFGVQYLFTKGKGIGTGDFALGIALGTSLGFPLAIIAAMVGYVIGAFHAMYLLMIKKADRRTPLPLGVYLMLGLAITFMGSSFIFSWLGIVQ